MAKKNTQDSIVNVSKTLSWTENKKFSFLDNNVPATSSPERVFVYILKLNTFSAAEGKPFYVGSTNNLKKRLNNHRALNWHFDITNKSSKILIAGTIPLADAAAAVNNLKERLQKTGCVMFNDFKKQRSVDFFNLKMLTKYNQKSFNISSILTEWETKWDVKHKENNNSGKRLPEESSITRIKNIYLQNPSVNVLIASIKSKKYQSSAAVMTSQKIAKTYDEVTGEATFAFKNSENPNKNIYLLGEAKKIVHFISSDWELKEPLILGKTLNFALTVNVKRELQNKR